MPISEEELRKYLIALIIYTTLKLFFPEPKIPYPLATQISAREYIRRGL